MKNKKTQKKLLKIGISSLTVFSLFVPISLISCSSIDSSKNENSSELITNKNPDILQATKKPESLLGNIYLLIKNENNDFVDNVTISNGLDLNIQFGTLVAASKTTIQMPSIISELFVYNGIGFSSNAKLSYESKDVQIVDNKIELINDFENNKTITIDCFITEENKISQNIQFKIILRKDIDQAQAKLTKFTLGGQLTSGLKTDKCRELLDDINIFKKNIDLRTINNKTIDKVMKLFEKYSQLTLTIQKWDETNSSLVLNLKGTYINQNIDETIILSGFDISSIPKDKKYKILSDLELNADKYIDDCQTIDKINSWTQDDYKKYIKELVLYDESSIPYVLNVSDVTNMKISVEVSNEDVILKEISFNWKTMSYDSSTDSWKTTIGETVSVNVSYGIHSYKIIYPKNDVILQYMVDHFLEIDYSQISNVSPSRLAFDITESPSSLPIKFNDLKAKKYGETYFGFKENNQFIFTANSGDELSSVNDEKGQYTLRFSVKPSNLYNLTKEGKVLLEGLGEFSKKHQQDINTLSKNSGLLNGNASKLIMKNLKTNNQLLESIKSLKENDTKIISQSELDMVWTLFTSSWDKISIKLKNMDSSYKNKGINFKLFDKDLSTSISIKDNTQTSDQTIFFDFENKTNSFAIPYLEMGNFMQSITKNSNGYTLRLSFDYHLSLTGSNNTITIPSELTMKILDSELNK